MSVLLVGDLHVDKLSRIIPDFTDLVMKTLTNTVKDIQERHSIDTVVIAGDIFDSAFPSQHSIVTTLKHLTRIDAKVMLLLGNHDYADNEQHSLMVAKWVESTKSSNLSVIDEPTTIVSDDHKYLALPHPYVQPLPKGYTAGIGHFAVNGAKADNGFKVRSKHCPKGKWILGDFHTPQAGRANSCHFEYIGSLTQLAWNEGKKKRVLVLEDGDTVSVPVKQLYSLNKVTVSDEGDLPDTSHKRRYYHLQTNEFFLPAGYLNDNPTVLKVSALSKQKDKRASVLLENNEYTLDPLKRLPDFLRSKKVGESVVERAVELAKELKVIHA